MLPAPMTPTSTAIIFTIGTEITRGELVDLNSAWLADELTRNGYEVKEIASVPDDDEAMLTSLERVSAQADIVITTGGLGPTSDDRTTEIVARLLKQDLVLHRPSEERIQALLDARGRSMTVSNRKQALFPSSATILTNERGTAPGFFVDYAPTQSHRCRLFFMPGVPNEMKGIFGGSLTTHLPQSDSWTAVRKLQTCGIAESEIGDRLKPLENKYDVIIGYRASAGRIEIKVLKSGARVEKAELESACNAAFEKVKLELGPAVMGIGRKGLAEILIDELKAKNLTLATAESCTGGLAGAKLTDIAGSSAVYKGGVICYDNSVKSSLLKVDPSIFINDGAVSQACAHSMSQGVQLLLGVDCAISWTGIAGPGGGQPDKPVGLVHFSIVTPKETLCFQRTFLGGRQLVREYAVNAAFYRLIQAIRSL